MLKKLIPYPIIVLLFATFWFLSPFDIKQNQSEENITVEGTIISVLEEQFQIEKEDGEKIIVENDESLSVSPREFITGDTVILTEFKTPLGESGYYIADYFRQNTLIIHLLNIQFNFFFMPTLAENDILMFMGGTKVLKIIIQFK